MHYLGKRGGNFGHDQSLPKLYMTRKLSYRKDNRAMRPMTMTCRGALKIFGSPWLRPRLLFPKFSIGFCSDWAYKCACKIWSP